MKGLEWYLRIEGLGWALVTCYLLSARDGAACIVRGSLLEAHGLMPTVGPF